MSKCGDGRQPHKLDRVGHDGDGDEVEFDDEDEDPCAQGEGGHVCLMGDILAVSFTLA